MNWIPIAFGTFKGVVLTIGMFFAIKWHYDQGKKGKKTGKRALLRAGGGVAAVFVLSLLALGLATFIVIRMLGLELTY